MKIGVYSRNLEDHQINYFYELIKVIINQGAELYILENHFVFLENKLPPESKVFPLKNFETIVYELDYIISLGGDGTILDCVVIVKDSEVPIIGINTGRLGFLAPYSIEQYAEVIDMIQQHTAEIDKRNLIHLDSNLPIFNDTPFALNECVICKSDPTSTIKIHAYLNGEYLSTFWADGVIISTPTGSTGYNLSCNGPIVFPMNECLVLTPISPHNLNIRSLIIPDKEVLSFEVESRNNEFVCSLDTRKVVVPTSTTIAIRKENFKVSLIRKQESDFMFTLRNKLTWGMDKRNY
ncbi:MAG: NAD kinase [Alphaproteobacteria bacterium]|nr:NAD kinase [Alphaproteobacteria bacterium]